jgi:hypothetical protein
MKTIIIISFSFLSFLSFAQVKDPALTLKKLQGNWRLEGDTSQTIQIINTKWSFSNNFSASKNTSSTYEITVTDNHPKLKQKKLDAEFLVLGNGKDTLFYEVVGLFRTSISLMKYPSGKLCNYNKFKGLIK